MDTDRLLHQNEPSKAHEWAKSTKRGFLFLDRDQVEIVESKLKAEREKQQRQANARQREEERQ